ncbi:MAG: biotin/lipoyl-containing protein [Candidatus Bathyarchaeia archaeon]
MEDRECRVQVKLEAMKMENEISAPSEGTVKEVKVAAGATVGKGDAMVILQ